MKSISQEFVYVDTAVDGPNNRNNIKRLEDFKPNGHPDCYTTALRFSEDLRHHVNKSGSVEKYDGPAKADFIHWDFDSKEDPSKAQADACDLVRLLLSLGVPANAIRIYWSGSKGFSVEVPIEFFDGLEPSVDVPLIVKTLALELARNANMTLDTSVYDRLRLWRCPNTRNSKSGLFKVPLTVEELRNLTIEEIKELAKEPRHDLPQEPDPSSLRPVPILVEMLAGVRAYAMAEDVTEEEMHHAVVAEIARHMPANGRHNDYAMPLAGFLLRHHMGGNDVEEICRRSWEKVGAPDEALEDLKGIIRATADKLEEGKEATGGTTLEENFPGLPGKIALLMGWNRPAKQHVEVFITDLEQVEKGKRDADQVWDMVSVLAALDQTDYGRFRAKLGKLFGRSLSLTRLDAAVKQARDKDQNGDKEDPTQSAMLVDIAREGELFHDPDDVAFISFIVGGHQETYKLRSQPVKVYLARRFYEAQGNPPGAQALEDALRVLEGIAVYEAEEHNPRVRLAENEGNIYVDLANDEWEVVEVTVDGWRVIPASETPVRFRRAKGMLPLPYPAPPGTGSLGGLRKLLNLPEEEEGSESWILILAWLVAAMREQGPYPILALQGRQGSAKSTAERILRALTDPSTTPLRTTPRNERDLMIAASNSWVVAFDNLSGLDVWLSDALCRLSTGGGFSTRGLYTDDEETLFDAQRPIVLNGIHDVGTRPDLLDRTLIVELPVIDEDRRKTERELWTEFEQEHPYLLGGLLDAVARALRELPNTKLEKLPRMADFALWITAAEKGLGLEEGAFMTVYAENREEAQTVALEADPVGGAVLAFMANRDEWVGTATELLAKLSQKVDDSVRKSTRWPKDRRKLGGRLKQLAPALKTWRIEYSEFREPGTGKRLKRLRKLTEGPDGDPVTMREDGVTIGDDERDGTLSRSTPDRKAESGHSGVVCDDSDTELRTCSESVTISDAAAHPHQPLAFSEEKSEEAEDTEETESSKPSYTASKTKDDLQRHVSSQRHIPCSTDVSSSTPDEFLTAPTVDGVIARAKRDGRLLGGDQEDSEIPQASAGPTSTPRFDCSDVDIGDDSCPYGLGDLGRQEESPNPPSDQLGDPVVRKMFPFFNRDELDEATVIGDRLYMYEGDQFEYCYFCHRAINDPDSARIGNYQGQGIFFHEGCGEGGRPRLEVA